MNNGTAIGYALITYKKLYPKATREQLQKFENIMRGVMDLTDEEDAYEVYQKN